MPLENDEANIGMRKSANQRDLIISKAAGAGRVSCGAKSKDGTAASTDTGIAVGLAIDRNQLDHRTAWLIAASIADPDCEPDSDPDIELPLTRLLGCE